MRQLDATRTTIVPKLPPDRHTPLPLGYARNIQPTKTMRTFEICYFLLTSPSAPMQRAIVQATDSMTARRIFEQQNPATRVASQPREVR